MTSRPIYETDASQRAEQELASVIERKWRCKLHKMPIRYGLDYMAERNDKAVAYIELKVRTCKKQAFAEYMLALSKWIQAGLMRGATSLPCYLCVRWTDASGYIDLGAVHGVKFAKGGRTDRGDWQDVEPVALIPIDQFKELPHG